MFAIEERSRVARWVSPVQPGAATPRRRGTMGSVLSSEPQAPEERSALQKEINKVMLWLRLGLGLLTISATLYPNQVIAENPVVIFSKTWCRTCHVYTAGT